MSFSDNLQALRKANNISQEQLAERLNVTRQTVSKWETGGYPEMDKIIALCDMFGCTMDELITGTVNVNKADDADALEPVFETGSAFESDREEDAAPASEPKELSYTYTAPEHTPYTPPQPAYDPTYVPPKQNGGKTATVVAITVIAVVAMLLISGVLIVWIAVNGVFGNLFGGLGVNFSDRNINFFGLGGTKYTYANSSQYLAASDFNVSDSIDRIDIDWIKGGVSIVPAEGDEIHVYEIAETSSNGDGVMRYRIHNGTVYIKFREPGRYWNLDGKPLIIEVPEAISEAISLKVSTVSADIASESMSFSDTDINTVSGITSLSDYNTPRLDIDSVSGGITAYGDIKRADIDMVSGNVAITANTSFSDISVDTVSGDVWLEAKSNFSSVDVTTVSGKVELRCGTPRGLDIDTVSGSINVDGSITEKGGYTVNNVDGLGQVEIGTVSGDVTVKTK